jgi:hypothetical protein
MCAAPAIIKMRGGYLNHDVELTGLAKRADLNGRIGTAFTFDASSCRYGVLTEGERVSVKQECLRRYEHPVS